MNKINQRVELAANMLIVVVACLLIGVLVQRYFFNSPATAANQPQRMQPTVGKKISLENINFSEAPKTVVLALQTTCKFCNDSAPFYKRLLEQTKGKNVKFVAVFPTPVEASQKHLTELGIIGFEVKQAPITQLDVSGTPTLIIANSNGEVEKSWVGRLQPNKESEVINHLNS